MNTAPSEPAVRALAHSLLRRVATVGSEVERVRGMEGVRPSAVRAVERVADAFARAGDVAGSVLIALDGARGRPPHERQRVAERQYDRLRGLVPEIARARDRAVAIGAAAVLGAAVRAEEAVEDTT